MAFSEMNNRHMVVYSQMMQVETARADGFTAHGKPLNDVTYILKRDFMLKNVTIPTYECGPLFCRLRMACAFLLALLRAPQKCVLVYQHPRGILFNFFGRLIFRLCRMVKNFRMLLIVHDIDGLRTVGKIDQVSAFYLTLADVVIVHNKAMKERLVAEGFEESKFVELGMFDYLLQKTPDFGEVSVVPNSVVIAGNLQGKMASYIYG